MKITVTFDLDFPHAEPRLGPGDLLAIAEHLASELSSYEWDMAIGPAVRWTDLKYIKGKEPKRSRTSFFNYLPRTSVTAYLAYQKQPSGERR